jgi:hypothetical protein
MILLGVSGACIAIAFGIVWLRSGHDPVTPPETADQTQQVVERLQAVEKPPADQGTEPAVERGSRRRAR